MSPEQTDNANNNQTPASQPNVGNNQAPQVINPTQGPTETNTPSQQPPSQTTPSFTNVPISSSEMKKNNKNPFKKLSGATIALVIIGILLMGSAAAYFGYIAPNKPENIWKSALNNSAKAIDSLAAYSEDQQEIKGAKVTGNFSVTGEGLSGDANIEGVFYEKQGQSKVDIGFAGSRYQAELRAIEANNSDYPDLYVKLDGLNGIGALLGAASGNSDTGRLVDSVDGQWIFIDHTLIAGTFSDLQASQSDQPELTNEQAVEIIEKLNEVNKEYLFSTDESKAVFNVVEEVGKEDFEDRSSYKFIVGVNKDNLKKYIEKVQDELKSTELPRLIGSDEEYNKVFEDMIEGLEDANTEDFESETAEVWVDMKTKLIRNVRFTDEDNDKNIFDISLLYDGGDSYPLRFRFNEEESKTDVSFTMTLDTADDSFEFSTKGSVDNEIEFSGTVKVVPHNEPVDVQKPSNAKSINEIAASLYSPSQGSGLDGSAGGSSNLGNNQLLLNRGLLEGFSL